MSGWRLERTHERLGRAPRLLVERGRAKLEHSAGRLRALSPKATLERGLRIVRADERIVRSGAAVQQGERVEVELADGGFGARVEERADDRVVALRPGKLCLRGRLQ